MAFTVTEAALEQGMMAKLPPNDQSALQRVYLAGAKLLFSQQTHNKVMAEFEADLQKTPDVATVLGSNMAHVMMLLFQESKGTMPGNVVIPAGILLLAKACEFLNTTKVVVMTDKIFADAAHMLSTVLLHQAQQHGQGGAQAAPQPAAGGSTPPPQPPSTGLLGEA